MTAEKAIKRYLRWLPATEWLATYQRRDALSDGVAAVIVAIMLIPQGLAYALLAGLPPQTGLYASILPLVVYAFFGTSRTLSVGPMAVMSLMTAAAVSRIATQGTAEYLTAAMMLAFMSGMVLVVLGVLRLGWIVNLLSRPVISGFVSASGVLIAASQLKYLLGVPMHGGNLSEMLASLTPHLADFNWPTLCIGAGTTLFLFWARKGLKPLLRKIGLKPLPADLLTKAAPVLAVIVTTLIVAGLHLTHAGVAVVGEIPKGLPALAMPVGKPEWWHELLLPAALIGLISFISSISVAQALAAKRRERLNANHELFGLGAANLASAFSGGFPITGGFSRSVVNFEAGAVTPMAGVFTAGGIALAALFLTPLMYYLPKATLAATIIVAVLPLIDIGEMRKIWRYSRSDFAAMAATIAVVLAVGVESGVVAGVAASILLFLWRTSTPHVAIIGQVPGTEHFRNVLRHQVNCSRAVLSVRVDESLYFANARNLEDQLYDAVLLRPTVKHVVIMCSAINQIDASALDSLESLNRRLQDAGVKLHLSEVKGPVMDHLRDSDLLSQLSGQVYLSHYEAIKDLDPDCLATPDHH
ncbi:SulP family inorganic anion transporter [Mangrovitalea sediminis]|uniref:SulP family inorganic anion transporter n=1 Tax=Mangrovitalea sediminis TaxID=1982043 RepID=UPI001D0D4828|nr:sulfate permease [Mangrovitalea sediminis]